MERTAQTEIILHCSNINTAARAHRCMPAGGVTASQSGVKAATRGKVSAVEIIPPSSINLELHLP